MSEQTKEAINTAFAAIGAAARAERDRVDFAMAEFQRAVGANGAPLYARDGALARSLRAARGWNEDRLLARAIRESLAAAVQLALLDAGRPMTAAELAPLVGALEADVAEAMAHCERRGWIRFK